MSSFSFSGITQKNCKDSHIQTSENSNKQLKLCFSQTSENYFPSLKDEVGIQTEKKINDGVQTKNNKNKVSQ